MLNHTLVATLEESASVAQHRGELARRASLGAEATVAAKPAASTAMIAFMALGGVAGGLVGYKLAGLLGALAAGGAGVYAGHLIEKSRETTAANNATNTTTKDAFTRADYAAAIDKLSAQPDFQKSLDPTNSLDAAQIKTLLDSMKTQSLALWDTGETVDQADMAIESYARTKDVEIVLPSTAASATLADLSAAVKGMTTVFSATTSGYSRETREIGQTLAKMLRYRAISTAPTPEAKALVTSTIDDAFKKIDATTKTAGTSPDGSDPGGSGALIATGIPGIATEFAGPPKSPADVLARDPRPTGNPAGVLTSDWPAERRKARFPASQKVSNSLPRPVYRPIIGFSGTADAPVPVYSDEVWSLEPLVVGTVLEGLYSIDGVTYWVGDPATPPGTVSAMFPTESSSEGWSSKGAKGNLYLPTQGDLYLIQQAFLPAEGTYDPDRIEAVFEIQQLIDGAGGLRPLGPKNPTDPSDPHMPPVLLNVKPVSSGGEEFTFTPDA